MQRLTGDDKQLLHQDRWDQVKSLGQGNEEEKEERADRNVFKSWVLGKEKEHMEKDLKCVCVCVREREKISWEKRHQIKPTREKQGIKNKKILQTFQNHFVPS